jgi:glycosyltransferase involved in cell wall biosynthesis
VSDAKISVIYNGLDSVPAEIPDLYQRPPVVLTVANFNPRKGLIEYLEAVDIVHKACPQARFVLAGRDDMQGLVQSEIIRRGLSGCVDCPGYVDSIGDLMLNSRVFVLPSLWGEGLPTSILEAMAHGLPVVAYDIDGIAELVRNDIDGYLVQSGRTQAMAEAIIACLMDSEIAIQMSQSGRSRIVEGFGIDEMLRSHREAFS